MASKREVIWSAFAVQELNDILDYLETKWSKRQSEDFFNKLIHAIELIRLNPYQFPVILKEKNYHKCAVTKHNTIYYSIPGESDVRILNIFDTSQDPGKLPLIK